MSDRRADRRRIDRRAFRPAVDGRLEDRVVQSRFGAWGYLYPAGHIQTAANGQAVDITTDSGQSFFISVANGGVVRAYAMPGGRFGLKLLGTNPQSAVTINPVIDSILKQSAHTFNSRQTQYNGLINIGSISVATGQIFSIEGYKTAVLSGPLVATGMNPINRIAFDALAPGATIITGGDLDTLDIYTSANLSGANTGINVGRNLNFLSANGDIDVTNGANIIVNQDLGQVAQPAKGTGPSSIPSNATTLASTNVNTTFSYQAAFIQGNVFIAPGSLWNIKGAIDSELFVGGTFIGGNNLVTQGLRVASSNNNVGSLTFLGNNNFIVTAAGLPNGIYPFSLPVVPTVT